MTGPAVQDYLKTIYKLQQADGAAATSLVAQRLGVSAPSVTAMFGRLAGQGLLRHTRYRGAVLTEAGSLAALQVIRRHRLMELFLVSTLGLPLHEADKEAERLEHALSPALEARIDQALGRPTTDPHGDPIPSATGQMSQLLFESLDRVAAPATVLVRRVSDADPLRLRDLALVGLVPGAQVEVEGVGDGGALEVGVEGVRHHVAPEVARAVFVEVLEPMAR